MGQYVVPSCSVCVCGVWCVYECMVFGVCMSVVFGNWYACVVFWCAYDYIFNIHKLFVIQDLGTWQCYSYMTG